VVVRTLDVGGDKLSETIRTPQESNPFLGLRALRLCLAYPELFRSQIRPLLRAAAGREIHILLPMVSGVEEVIQAKEIIFGERDLLSKKGVALPTRILIGAMIEIPSAAIEAQTIAEEVDFFSIGTNDLTQYTLAVDRVNKMVGHLYHETHPAVLRLISMVVETGRKTGTPIAVCGEMAGSPLNALLLIGLGVRNLSMSPTQIGRVRQAIRGVECAAMEELARRLLTCRTATEVRDELSRHIHDLTSVRTAQLQ
jgi:phosphotransferase system enzyme I (PtsI)